METEQLEKRKKIILELLNDRQYVPMKQKEIAIILGIPREQRNELAEVLDALLSEGKIGVSKRGKYAPAKDLAVRGTFHAAKRGYGFVTPKDAPAGTADYYISPDDKAGAMDGDTVDVAVKHKKNASGDHRTEARVIKIVTRAHTELAAVYDKKKGFGFAVPSDPRFSADIFIPAGKDAGASDGDHVMVTITDYGSARKNPEGFVSEILGGGSDPGIDILTLLKTYGYELDFPKEVTAEAEKITPYVTEEETRGRKDLRGLPTVTIDGEDAKDLDDAVTIKKHENGFTLGVHIADVSHYVAEGSAIDGEAQRRGTSVYLTDRVIPMLPTELSNGICSLNAGRDRLAISCIMEYDQAGRMTSHEIVRSVINVDRRMTYTAVQAILDGDEALRAEYSGFTQMFMDMQELSSILGEARRKNGSIDFDIPECRIILDEKGFPVDIGPLERDRAHNIIEEFMIAANVTVAEDYYWQDAPFIYRNHETPDRENINELARFASKFGIHMRSSGGQVHPGEIQRLLKNAAGSPGEAIINQVALRSMKRAVYSPVCTGHFGLAEQYYCHFTSPIRRYPDLMVHRIISENLAGSLDEERAAQYNAVLPGICAQCSYTERRADEAERDAQKLKKCEYMSCRTGEEYSGIISGLTKWGIYVELPNTIEGMIALGDLKDDHYELNEREHELKGAMAGRTFVPGQALKVRVKAVDPGTRTIDLELAGRNDSNGKRKH